MRKVLFVLSLFILSGCGAFAGKESPLIQVGELREVEGCQFLKSFIGPESYGMYGTPYIGNFKNEALEKAEKLGATHTLWATDDAGIKSRGVLKAYKCPPEYNIVKPEAEEQ
jgi:hypothetical protein